MVLDLGSKMFNVLGTGSDDMGGEYAVVALFEAEWNMNVYAHFL